MFKISLPLCSVLFLIAAACKSYHADPGVREAMRKSSEAKLAIKKPLTPLTEDPASVDPVVANSLIIKKLDLPSEVSQFNRTCVILKTSGSADTKIDNYTLATPITVEPGKTYSITIEVYQNKDFRYANAYCTSDSSFTASKGRNIFTIPVCPEEGTESIITHVCES